MASGGGNTNSSAGGPPYVSQRQIPPSGPVPGAQYADSPCPVYLGDKSVTVVAQLPVATVSVVGTSFLVQSKCVRLIYPFTMTASNYSELV
jgi:hypothetical protein